jgi:hypothetical protein
MAIFDLAAQARNTAIIRQSMLTTMEQMPRPARQLATMTPTPDDKIQMRRMKVGGAGLAPLKAIGASVPIYSARVQYTENYIELVQIAEKSPIDERLRRQLESTDEDIRMRAGLSIEELGQRLFLRNENRSDKMVMTAILTGQLPIVFEDEPGQGFTIIYDYDPTHLVNATNWNNPTTGTPITDIEATQVLLGNSAGQYGIHFWMNGETFRNAIWSDEAKFLLTGSDRGQRIPTLTDINVRLREPNQVQWHVMDAGYQTENSFARGLNSLNKWIPDDIVIMTTSDPFEGEALVEQFDGRVLVRTGFDSLQLRQGQQSFAKIDDSDTYNWHQVSTRMPRINRPECIAIMDVGA